MALLHLPSSFICPLSVPVASPLPYLLSISTVSLSFSASSHEDTNTCQSDPKQMRQEEPYLSNETQIKRNQTIDPDDWFPRQAWLEWNWFLVLSLSQINASAVLEFKSSALYEGLRTVGLQTGQFIFPRELITLVRQGKEQSVRDSKGNEQLERGGGGT